MQYCNELAQMKQPFFWGSIHENEVSMKGIFCSYIIGVIDFRPGE
jgi:hypothetical protein